MECLLADRCSREVIRGSVKAAPTALLPSFWSDEWLRESESADYFAQPLNIILERLRFELAGDVERNFSIRWPASSSVHLYQYRLH